MEAVGSSGQSTGLGVRTLEFYPQLREWNRIQWLEQETGSQASRALFPTGATQGQPFFLIWMGLQFKNCFWNMNPVSNKVVNYCVTVRR